jgi:hypothetical protein
MILGSLGSGCATTVAGAARRAVLVPIIYSEAAMTFWSLICSDDEESSHFLAKGTVYTKHKVGGLWPPMVVLTMQSSDWLSPVRCRDRVLDIAHEDVYNDRSGDSTLLDVCVFGPCPMCHIRLSYGLCGQTLSVSGSVLLSDILRTPGSSCVAKSCQAMRAQLCNGGSTCGGNAWRLRCVGTLWVTGLEFQGWKP